MKKTKKILWEEIKNLEEVSKNPDLKEFVEAEIARLEKRSNSKKNKERDALNQSLADAIVIQLEPNRLYRVTEIIGSVKELTGLTTQKVSPICRKMASEGRLVMTTEKRVNLYSLPKEGGVVDVATVQ